MTREKLEALEGRFWTDLDEAVAEIGDTGIEVYAWCDEYITVVDEEDEDEEILIYLGHAGNTMWIQDIR